MLNVHTRTYGGEGVLQFEVVRVGSERVVEFIGDHVKTNVPTMNGMGDVDVGK